jgi:hypothetical protein
LSFPQLLTHGPPVGHGDNGHDVAHAGCVDLLHCVQQRVRPLVHLFGHLHAGYGVTRDTGSVPPPGPGGVATATTAAATTTTTTAFINASSCDESYLPNNAPVVFDVTPSMLASFQRRFEFELDEGALPTANGAVRDSADLV